MARQAARAAAGPLFVAALTAAALLFVLRPLSLSFPAPGLDSSWIAVMGRAAEVPARFGVDLAFTYGPASALVTRFYTDGYLAGSLPILAAVALAFGLATLRLARVGAGGRRGAAALVGAVSLATAAGLGAELALDQDSFLFALALALFLLDLMRGPGDRASQAAVTAGAALMGVLALAKTSYGAAALGLFALADLRAAARRRRVPLLVPLAVLGFLAAFAAHGQRFGDLPAYLDLQGQVAAGYGEAMALPAGRGEIAGYLGGSALLIAAVALGGWPGRADRAAAALGAGFILAIGLKAGFVRADTHPQIAWSLLGLGGLAVAAGPALRRSIPGAAALAGASLLVLWVVGPLFLLAATERAPRLANLPEAYRDMGEGLAAELGAWRRFLADPAGFAAAARAAKARAWAAVAAAEPLPPLAGGVDMIPSDQSAILANGLDYHPRPSFQDYSTYTAGLIAANSAFYAGPDAPEWVLFGAGALDDRYPDTTEGALWPDLMRRYAPMRRAGPWLAMRRRAAPLPDVLGPPVRFDAALGAPVTLAEHLPGEGPVFARVTVEKTLLGRLAAALFRPPALALRVTLAGGSERSYRFIPAIGAGGFLLSPTVTDVATFAELGFGAGVEAGGERVAGFAVGGSPWSRLFYAPTAAVELRAMTVSPGPPDPDARALADDLARGRPWRRLARSLGRAGALDGDRLSAPAPTALTVPTEGASRLRVGFGIEDGAWREGHTAGVCFALRAAGASEPLWRRCLDPAALPADRGPQSAEIDLPRGLGAVTAETSCPEGCDWGWSYWSGIGPDG